MNLLQQVHALFNNYLNTTYRLATQTLNATSLKFYGDEANEAFGNINNNPKKQWFNYLLLASLVVISTMPATAYSKAKNKKEDFNRVKALANDYLQAFAPKEEENDEYTTQSKPTIEKDATKLELKKVEISDEEAYKICFDILNNHVNQGKIAVEDTIDPRFIKTMELFYGGADESHTLMNAVNKTTDKISKTTLAWQLSQPTGNKDLLLHNQAIVRELATNPHLLSQLTLLFEKLATAESDLFSFFVEEPDNNQKIMQLLLFFNNPGFTKFNKSTKALSWSTGLLSGMLVTSLITVPLTYIGLGAGYIWRGMNLSLASNRTPFNMTLLGGGVIGAGALAYMVDKQGYNQLKLMSDTANYLQKRLISVRTYLDTLEKIRALISTNAVFKNNFVHLKYLNKLFEKQVSADCQTFMRTIKYKTFTGKPSFWFSLTGRVLAAYKQFQDVKYEFADPIIAAGQLGAFVSAAHLYNEHQNKSVKYTFVDFDTQATKPYIKATGFWNPRLNPNVAVANNFSMGKEYPAHAIFTGGNGLGKSTIMNGLLYTILIAQTWGIAPAQEFIITPFSRIMCHANVRDDIGEGLSGFMAELALKDLILKDHAATKPDEFIITVFDELFKSTNPEDAAELSKQLLKQLATYPNALTLLATHLAPVTELEKEGSHANYHPGSIPQSNGLPVLPTHTIEPGVSFDHNAQALYQHGKVTARK